MRDDFFSESLLFAWGLVVVVKVRRDEERRVSVIRETDG